MKLYHGLHLGYCTNVYSGQTWAETLEALDRYTLAVRNIICPDRPCGISLNLDIQAARQLHDPCTLRSFRQWLDINSCYVFSINGFSYGQFQGTRVKESVYLPDWTDRARLEYTNMLFDILVRLLPPDIEGAVSTLPVSLKGMLISSAEFLQARNNLWHCIEHLARVCEMTGRRIRLALEPEPLCHLENGRETVHFYDQLQMEHPNDDRLENHFGISYDTCHFAVEFEDPQSVLNAFFQRGIRIAKLHLSNALVLHPSTGALAAANEFVESGSIHQVVVRDTAGRLSVFKDLSNAMAHVRIMPESTANDPGCEWRIHYHIPLHAGADDLFGTTSDHLLGVLDWLAARPEACSLLEMKVHSWNVLPERFRKSDLVEHLACEYLWLLKHLADRGLAPVPVVDEHA